MAKPIPAGERPYTGLTAWVKDIADLANASGEARTVHITADRFGTLENCKTKVRALHQVFASLRANTRKRTTIKTGTTSVAGVAKGPYDGLQLEWGELGDGTGYYVTIAPGDDLFADIPILDAKGEQIQEQHPDGLKADGLMLQLLKTTREGLFDFTTFPLADLFWLCEFRREDPRTMLADIARDANLRWLDEVAQPAWEARDNAMHYDEPTTEKTETDRQLDALGDDMFGE